MKPCNSLPARVSTARTLVEECTRDAEDIPAGVEADLWEALEFLTRLDDALDEVPEDALDEVPEDALDELPGVDGSLPTPRGDTEQHAESPDAEQPDDDGAGPRNGVEQSPGDAALPQVHSYSDIVVFRPIEGGASRYVAATPNTVKDLAEWR